MYPNYTLERLEFEHDLMKGIPFADEGDPLSQRGMELNTYYPRNLNIFLEKSNNQYINFENDNIINIGSFKDQIKYYYDLETGLIYFKENNKFSLSLNTCRSMHYDIIETAYLRNYLQNKKTLFETSTITLKNEKRFVETCELAKLFAAPILEYTVSTKKELEDLITNLELKLNKSCIFKKLWFRGQTKEFFSNRLKETVDTLGIKKQYCQVPLLKPSLGRGIVSNNNFNAVLDDFNNWVMALRIWILSQCPHWSDYYGINTYQYNELLKNVNLPRIQKYIKESLDDIGDILNARMNEDVIPEILCMQQYGLATSFLDITEDLDTALFFTHMQFDNESKRFFNKLPKTQRVIYIFAECKGTSSYKCSQDIFHLSTLSWKLAIPLRIKRQKCGILTGANNFAFNNYGYRVLAKVFIDNDELISNKTVDYLFPNKSEDTLSYTLSQANPKLNGLY